MNPFQFLKQLNSLPAAGKDGVRVTKEIKLLSLRTAAGLVLDASTTNPRVVAYETNGLAVTAVASSNVLGSFVFTVPNNYDESSDELKLNLVAVSGGTTDVPTITATAYRKRAATALTAALTVVASAAIPTSTAKAGNLTVNLSGNLLKGGDVLTINLVSGAHTTDAVLLESVSVQYKSGIVFQTLSAR